MQQNLKPAAGEGRNVAERKKTRERGKESRDEEERQELIRSEEEQLG